LVCYKKSILIASKKNNKIIGYISGILDISNFYKYFFEKFLQVINYFDT